MACEYSPLRPRRTPRKISSCAKYFCDDDDEFTKVTEIALLKTPEKRMKSCSVLVCTPPKKKKIDVGDVVTPSTKGFQTPTKQCPLSPVKLSQNVVCSPAKDTRNRQLLKALDVATSSRPICRDEEMETINAFLDDHVDKNLPGSLYITGPPGTGKSACVNYCLRSRKWRKNVNVINVNCMSLTTANKIFKRIVNDIGIDVKAKSVNAMSDLLKLHICTTGSTTLLVLDELDQIETRHQEVLYQVFEWSSLPNSRFVVVGIANALQPLNQTLPHLGRFKCKPQFLQFSPYKRQQIKMIIQDRLQLCKEDNELLLRPEVIEYCSRSTASHNGDIRKALAMLSQATMMVANENTPKSKSVEKMHDENDVSANTSLPQVHLQHLQKVMTSVGSSLSSIKNPKTQLPLQQKIIIFCVMGLLRNSKIKEVTFGKLQETYNLFCRKQQLSAVDAGDLMSLCSQLQDCGIVSFKKKSSEPRLTKLTLDAHEMDLEQILRQETTIAKMFEDKTLFTKKR